MSGCGPGPGLLSPPSGHRCPAGQRAFDVRFDLGRLASGLAVVDIDGSDSASSRQHGAAHVSVSQTDRDQGAIHFVADAIGTVGDFGTDLADQLLQFSVRPEFGLLCGAGEDEPTNRGGPLFGGVAETVAERSAVGRLRDQATEAFGQDVVVDVA